MKLHESGITTSNQIRSSHTNLGLVSFGLETSTNGDCKCNSMWGILEILGTIVVCIIIMFIGYRCLLAYCNRREQAKELKRRNFMELVDQKLTTRGDHQMLQMSPQKCSQEHLHFSERYINGSQNLSPQAPKPTFE